jgi:ATP-binding cassette subfamily F protein uup
LLLVSHDRAFLDNVVTSTLVFESGGRVQEYVGGYEDWIRQRGAAQKPAAPAAEPRRAASPSGSAPQGSRRAAGATTSGSDRRKLSFNERRELSELPERIESLETEHVRLEATVASPSFYKESRDAIARTLARLEELERSLAEAYGRWADLDSRAS